MVFDNLDVGKDENEDDDVDDGVDWKLKLWRMKGLKVFLCQPWASMIHTARKITIMIVDKDGNCPKKQKNIQTVLFYTLSFLLELNDLWEVELA